MLSVDTSIKEASTRTSHSELRELAKTCKHEGCLEQRIRDCIVVGIHDGDTLQKPEKSTTLTLKDTIEICRANEAVKRDRTTIKGESDNSTIFANAMKHKHQQHKRQSRDTHATNVVATHGKCGNCGKTSTLTKNKCQARNKQCRLFEELNHFATVCRSRLHAGKTLKRTGNHMVII